MVPIHLDPDQLAIGLVGDGALAVRRLNWLQALGCRPLVFSTSPDKALIDAAGPAFLPRRPGPRDLAGLQVMWIADLPQDEAAALAGRARRAKILVNTEDVLPLCDFHTPSILERGRLVISAGTGGASPALAAFVRAKLDTAFPDIWGEVLEEIARDRLALKAAGADMAQLKAAAEAKLAHYFPDATDPPPST